MNEKMHSPEVINNATINQIVQTATEAVDKYGSGRTDDVLGGNPKYKSGLFILRSDNIEGLSDPSKVPTLSINIPVDESVDKAAWKVELVFGYQDAGLSNHLLIRKDNTIMISSYQAGDSTEYMTNELAREFSADLVEIVEQIGEDYIDPFEDLPIIDPR